MRKPSKIAIIGGGPSGLMCAETLLSYGHDVHIYDAMPSFGRKFLMAGKSGLNLTHNENYADFITRYDSDSQNFKTSLDHFTPKDMIKWANDLGIETFVGSSGRIFPKEMKAAPLLRSWLRKLKDQGLHTHVHHRWVDWQTCETPKGPIELDYDALVLATGSVCWPKLGSDGQWQSPFKAADIKIDPFQPSNCGFTVNWSDFFKDKFSGKPVKAIAINGKKGEFVITSYGVEGSAIYAASRPLRLALKEKGSTDLLLDLCPDRKVADIQNILEARGSKSISAHLKQRLKIDGVKAALLYEFLSKDDMQDPALLAKAIKSLPIPLQDTRPIEEAISCDGGVRWDELDDHLMLKKKPGVFVCGEMINWDAPTGGYLLTGCFALGKQAGLGVHHWLENNG